MALRWSDLDLERSMITIGGPESNPHGGALQRQTGRGLVEVETKSKESRRTLPLSKFARKTLDSHLELQERYREHLGPSWNAAGVIFPTAAGTLQDPPEALRRFHKVASALGLPSIRLHDLRHTAATLLYQQSVSPKRVQALLGHSTIGLTMNTYTHTNADDLRPVADAMDAIFEQGNPTVLHRS